MKSKGVLKIVSKKRPWYERLLAAVFYSIAIYLIFLFYKNTAFTHTEKYYIKSFKILASLIFIVTFGMRYSFNINHHFDFELLRYRIYYSVGPLGIGKWKKLKKLDRVSTFLNSRNECEVNIWDIRNNRYKITAFYEIEDAVIYGRKLAKELEIRFKERK